MCGIVGTLYFSGGAGEVAEEALCRMRDTMVHRGPDGAGTWVSADRRVGLGHRRLAIVDLSPSAAQPMGNEDGALQISFNGEIYNHAEIRAELVRLGGHRWKTDHSDTEVILHAFEQWGIDCVHRFRGMFAFALWDGRERKLWLVRDRIGVKPLYYSVHHGRIAFASEIKALLADPDQARAVDEGALYHYLSFLTAPAPQTLFQGIRKVRPGTWIQVDADGRMREERYWDVLDHAPSLDGVSEEEIAERLLDTLRASVRLRKVSDVPVGVFLSGGVDSSANAILFSEGETSPVKTFTIGYDRDYASYPNELPYARRVAERVGAAHHERRLSIDDLIEFLPRMVWLQDEPIADPVCVPIHYVSKLARDNGVIVCQVGEGSDELFCGYPGWQLALDFQRYDDWPVPQAVKRLGLLSLRLLGRQRTTYYEWLRRGSEGVPIFWGGAEAFTEEQKRRLLSPRLRAQAPQGGSWSVLEPFRRRFEERARDASHLNWMTYLDLNLRLPELLLMRVDKMSMGVSVEGRVPFLDHKLVELAMGIPSKVKTRNGTLKHILKRSVRGIVPEEVLQREKQGFGVPLTEWFLGEYGERARQEVDALCRETDFLDRAEVARLFDERRSAQLWYLLNLALWWKTFLR